MPLRQLQGIFNMVELTAGEEIDYGFVVLSEEEKAARAEFEAEQEQQRRREQLRMEEARRMEALVDLYKEGVAEHKKIKDANAEIQLKVLRA